MNDLKQIIGLTHEEESRIIKGAYDAAFDSDWHPKTLSELRLVRAMRLAVRGGFQLGAAKNGEETGRVINAYYPLTKELPEGFKTPYA